MKVNIKENKTLLSNISLLFIFQGSNYLLPLIAFPYLVIILGVENFGLIALSLATVNFFKILINYGFDLSATKEISEHRDNLSTVNEIINSIFIIKTILFFISLFLFTIIMFSFEIFSKNILLYYFTFLTVVGDVLFPIWLFQGIEKMKFIVYLNFISKIIFLVSIFFFVNNENDLLLVPLLTSLGNIISGIIAIIIIKLKFNFLFFIPKKEVLIYHFREGWYMFQGLFNMTIVNNSIILILGIFSAPEIVGHYAIAEKLIRAIKNMTSPISQAVYPHLAKMYKINKKYAYTFSIKITTIVSVIMLMISVIIAFYAQEILTILFSAERVSDVSVLSLKILSLFPFISSIIHIFCTQNMIFLGMKKLYAKVFLIASVFNIMVSIIFIPIYSYIAGAIIVLTTEIIIGIIMSYYIYRRIKNDK